MKSKGFTLIELMIVLAMVSIVGIIIFQAVMGFSNNQTVGRSFGINGYVEQRCINGLLFTVTNRNTTQVYDQFGHGVVCQVPQK